MLIITWIMSIIIVTYFAVGIIGIMIWEVVAGIKGACCVPSWIDNVYEFITEKMFFFFK